VLNLHVAKTREQAMVKGRPGHDEFCRFLSPYGRFSSYRNPDGSKVAFDHCPTVEESNAQKIQVIGSIDDAVDTIGFWRDLLDLEHICFFLDLPGLTREEMNEQMHLVAEEVFPRLGEPIERRPLTASPLV
jgi:ABC-type Na+ transport system ATPase subunit NatA